MMLHLITICMGLIIAIGSLRERLRPSYSERRPPHLSRLLLCMRCRLIQLFPV
jgi:hypothetical protein